MRTFEESQKSKKTVDSMIKKPGGKDEKQSKNEKKTKKPGEFKLL